MFFSFYQIKALDIYLPVAPRLKVVGDLKWDYNLMAI
jgi:hypothetical protein